MFMNDAVMGPYSAAERELLAELTANARCTCGGPGPAPGSRHTAVHGAADQAPARRDRQPADPRRTGAHGRQRPTGEPTPRWRPPRPRRTVTEDSMVNPAGRRGASVPSHLHGKSATY
jgi:hypothetical protein